VAVHAIEFFILFFAGPTLFAYTRHRIPAIPALWVLMAGCLIFLLRDPQFNQSRLWDVSPLRRSAPGILCLFAAAAAIGTFLVVRYMPPGSFLKFPRSNPRLWSLLMVFYPLLSVYPQGIIYRAFIFERYRDLFGPPWAIVLASAAAFAYVHVIYRNRIAVVLTSLGGILFALRYLQTGSVLVSSCEHALYGCAIFTIGVGRSFYYEALQRPLSSDGETGFAGSPAKTTSAG
jgi:membrane protease YdiL (CAAX protease family)